MAALADKRALITGARAATAINGGPTASMI